MIVSSGDDAGLVERAAWRGLDARRLCAGRLLSRARRQLSTSSSSTSSPPVPAAAAAAAGV